MASSGSERVILKARPDGRAILLQFRNVAKLGLAIALLSPQAQSVMAGLFNGIGTFGITRDMKYVVSHVPSALLLFNVLYWYVYQKSCEFVLTDERLIVRYGIFLRVEDEVELYRVVDVTQTINIVQRILGVGNIQVSSTDRTGTVIMPLIASPSNVRNAVRTEAERCKSRRGSVRILE